VHRRLPGLPGRRRAGDGVQHQEPRRLGPSDLRVGGVPSGRRPPWRSAPSTWRWRSPSHSPPRSSSTASTRLQRRRAPRRLVADAIDRGVGGGASRARRSPPRRSRAPSGSRSRHCRRSRRPADRRGSAV
jgi:hypothetical protein